MYKTVFTAQALVANVDTNNTFTLYAGQVGYARRCGRNRGDRLE